MKRTIGKKLLIGFMFVLLLLIIESVTSISAINLTEESNKQLIDGNMRNMMLAHDLVINHISQSDSINNYLLTGDKIYLFEYKEYAKKASNTIQHMLKTFKTEEDQEVIKQLAAFQMRYEEIIMKEISFKKEGNEVGYNNLLKTSNKTISNVFKRKIDELVEGQEELVQQGTKEVADSVNKTKHTVIYLDILSILIGTALSFKISHSISRPLNILAKYTEKIAAPTGKMDLEFPKIKSTIYEIKQLYESIHIAFQEITNHINQLDTAVQTDALTGIANRRTFDLVIQEQIQNHIPFSLILLDIDFFKKVNDTFGHLIGDDVLKYLTHTMQKLSRKGDLCFRYGGEEFAIIVPYGDKDTAISVAERLRMKIESNPSPTGEPITISLGIAIYPDHGQEPKEIIAAADEAMYLSKLEGRNQTNVYSKSNLKEPEISHFS